MNERDRLIELIQNAVDGCAKHWAEIIADHLLANGVIVPPCKVGDMTYTIIDDRKFEPLYISEAEILAIEYDANGIYISIDGGDFLNVEQLSDFDMFLTRKEAEQALKEREQK